MLLQYICKFMQMFVQICPSCRSLSLILSSIARFHILIFVRQLFLFSFTREY